MNNCGAQGVSSLTDPSAIDEPTIITAIIIIIIMPTLFCHRYCPELMSK